MQVFSGALLCYNKIMKNMLFVADGFTGGGLETRVIEQIKILKKKRVRFYLLCSKFNPEYKKYFTEVSEALKLSFQLHSASDVLADVDTICDFCKKHRIDYIECHPFLCTLPAALAAEKINIPISFTLHGVTSGDFVNGADYLPGRTLYHLMLSYGFDKYFAVAEYLTSLYSFLKNDSIVRNGVSLNAMKYRKFKNTKAVAIASRLDVIKSQLIIDFLPDAYKSSAINTIDIYGDGDGVPMIQSFIADNHMSDKVHIKGWEKNLPGKLSSGEYMLAFGMGRVALEAMSSGTPVGILGYGGFAGLVNRSNLQDFAKNNLTSWKSSDASLETELKRFFKKPSDYIFSKKDLAMFDAEAIWQKYYDIILKTSHSENIASQKVYKFLSDNPNVDIFRDYELFLASARMLADGDRPTSQKLFFAIFQNQYDTILELKNRLSIEKERNIQSNKRSFLQKLLHRN